MYPNPNSLFHISIPFSTIKSVRTGKVHLHALVFQFHLVRLKERGNRDETEDESEFQFHLVRLKDLVCVRELHIFIFQFHLVRLKVSHSVNSQVVFQFQFHLVRLKASFNNVFSPFFLFQFHLVRLKACAAESICPILPNFNSI